MTREDKKQAVEDLAVRLKENNVIYLADASELTVEVTNNLRRAFFQKEVSMTVVKNTLLKKAMESIEDRDFSELYDTLKGSTAILFANVGNAPAKVIKDFRKKNDKPILKGAWVEEAVFVGDDQLKALAEIKSKEELLGEIVGLLQSPAKNVISALQSGGSTIAGLVKTLQEK